MPPFNPKAVRGYNRRWRRLRGRPVGTTPARLRSAGRRYAARPHPARYGIRTPSGRVVSKSRSTLATHPRAAARIRARVRQHQIVAARLREARNALYGSYPFRRALVGRSGRTEDSPLNNPLWNTEVGNLFGTPGQVDRADYADFYDRLWRQAKGFYPSGKEPRLVFERSPISGKTAGGASVAAFVPFAGRPGHRSVYLGADQPQRAGLRPSEKRWSRGPDVQYARTLPIHEWVHVFQGRRANASAPLAEGGAEGFKSIVGRRLGYRPPTAPGYGPFMRQVVRRKGRRWILKGQFR